MLPCSVTFSLDLKLFLNKKKMYPVRHVKKYSVLNGCILETVSTCKENKKGGLLDCCRFGVRKGSEDRK